MSIVRSMGRPRKIRKSPQYKENLAASLELCKRVYYSVEDADDAIEKYSQISDASPRAIYSIELEIEGSPLTMYILARKGEEADSVAMHGHFKARTRTLRSGGGPADPRPKLEEGLRILAAKIESAKSFLALLEANGAHGDARIKEMHRKVSEGLLEQESLFAVKTKHFESLKNLSVKEAREMNKRFGGRKLDAEARIPESDSTPEFISASRPPILDPVDNSITGTTSAESQDGLG